MRQAAAGVLALLGACGQPKTDAARYSEALSDAKSFDGARRLCEGIEEQRLREDCIVGAAARFEVLEPSLCEGLQDELWAGECIFQLAERQAAHGDLALALGTCTATRFARKCGWHLVQDEAEASLDEEPEVAEARVEAFIGSRTVPDAPMQFWKIRFREQGAQGITLDESVCEGLRHPEPCQDAVTAHVGDLLNALGKANLDKVCADELGMRATRGGEPSWTLGPITTAAEEAWVQKRCRVPDAPPPFPGAGKGKGKGPRRR